MFSKQRFSTSSFLSLLLLALASGATVVWALSGSKTDSEIEFRTKEARYQSQIKSLNLALRSNSEEFDRERKLAVRLQRELQDANRQIDDLARQLGVAQRTISEKNKQLRKANLQRGASRLATGSKHARVETTSALIVSRAHSSIGLESGAQRRDRSVSPYSPLNVKRVNAASHRKHRTVTVKSRERSRLARTRSSASQVRVSSIGPIRSGLREPQSRQWPLSARVASQSQRVSSENAEHRPKQRIAAASETLAPTVIPLGVQRAKKVRRVAAVRQRRTRRARYARYSRLGRLNRQRSRRVVRKRRSARRSWVRSVLSEGYRH